MAYSAGLLAHYGYRPFEVRSCKTQAGRSCSEPGVQRIEDVKVVENIITADLLGSLTPIPQVQIGLRLPITWLNGQGINDQGLSLPDQLTAVGLGDMELEGKWRAYGEPTAPLVAGLALSVTAPLGHLTAKDKYVGDSTPTFAGRAILDGMAGPLSYALNLGGLVRGKSRVGRESRVASEGRYSVGVGFQVSPVLRALVDAFGSTRFRGTSGENTLEVEGGVQIQPLNSPLAFTLGAGTSVIRGIGSPRVRALFGVLFVAESRDEDNDVIQDKNDQCPTEAEDRDGYEDQDGCPDRDNDLDSIPDVADKCPMQAEDADGFEDIDGCPDLDNDKDGLADTADQCPLKPESKNGYKDQDGCPDESDVDEDGVADERDKCPKEPEDTDGFDDTDGCPDPDNDGDGVLDDQDECIDEAETPNEFEDQDGCPDENPKDAKKKK
jgi:hypothetical protein